MRKLLLFLCIALFVPKAIKSDNILFEEDFESYPNFTIKDADMGNWTIMDIDKADLYGVAGVNFPNNDSNPKSYMVFNSTLIEDPTFDDLSAYNGEKALIAFTPMEVGISSDDWLISPKINLEGDNLALIFQVRAARANYNHERFKVWVLPAKEADSKKFDVKNFSEKDFTLLSANPEYTSDYLVSGKQSKWIQLAYSLDEYKGEEVYLAIQHLSSSSGGFIFMLDDFKVVKNACLAKAENVEVTSITDSSAKISWSGNFSKYEIIYGKKGFSEEDAQKKITTSNEIIIEDLNRLTEYQYYVRPYCDDNGSETYMMHPYFFRTRLGEQPFEVNEFQSYYYGFEVEEDAENETGIEYDGLEIKTASGSSAIWRVTRMPEAREGEKVLRSSGMIFPMAPVIDTWAFTGGISLKAGQKVQISCWVKNPGPFNNNSLKIIIGKDRETDSQHTVLWQNNDITPEGYVQVKEDYEVFSTGTYYLGFHNHIPSDGSGIYDIEIDLIEVKDHEYLKNEQQFTILLFDDFEDETYTNFSTNIGEWQSLNPDQKEKIDSFFEEELKTAGFILINSLEVPTPTCIVCPSNYETHSGEQALLSFAASEPATNDWMISPKISLQRRGNILTFWAKAVSEDDYSEEFKVMISTKGTNIEDFTYELAKENLKDYLTDNENHKWIKFVYNLDEFANTDVYVAINNIGSFYTDGSEDKTYGLMLDDFKVVTGGCMEEVSNISFALSTFDDTTAFLSFTGSTYYYQVAFGKKGFTFNEDEIEFTTKRDYTFSDLELNTRYEVYVRAACDTDNPSETWFGPYEVHTRSGSVKLDYEYGFETDDITEDGWRIYSNTGIVDWKLANNENAGEQFGEKCMVFAANPNHNYSSAHLEFLFTPAITVMTGSTLKISLDAKVGEDATREDLQLVWNDVQGYTPDLKNITYFNNIENKEYKTLTTNLVFASYSEDRSSEEVEEEHLITFYIGFYVNPQNEGHKELSIDNLVINDITGEGIESGKNIKSTEISIYPNPTQEILNIRLSCRFNLLNTNLSVIDMNGKRIITKEYTPKLSVSELPSGIYTIIVSDGEYQESKLFIKE